MINPYMDHAEEKIYENRCETFAFKYILFRFYECKANLLSMYMYVLFFVCLFDF